MSKPIATDLAPYPNCNKKYDEVMNIAAHIILKLNPVHIFALLEIESPTTCATEENIVETLRNINVKGSVKPFPYMLIINGLNIETANAIMAAIDAFKMRLTLRTLQNLSDPVA